jgi:hypothetical protein
MEGKLVSGETIQAMLELEVVASGRGLVASISPNPGRRMVMTVRTTQPGRLSVHIFDPHGRLVRTLVNGDHRSAGYHDFALTVRIKAVSR